MWFMQFLGEVIEYIAQAKWVVSVAWLFHTLHCFGC